MERKDELKQTDIKNCACYYFCDIIKDKDVYSVDILLDKKLYETYKNTLIYNISYKTSTAPKPLCVRLDKTDGFIKVCGGEFRHLVLFDHELFDKICDKYLKV